MSNYNHQRQNDGLGTVLKWATGGFIVWNLLKPEAKDAVRRIFGELVKALADYQRQQEELERQRRIQGFLGGFVTQLKSGTTTFAQLPRASLDSLTESQAKVASSAMPALEQPNGLIGQPFEADLAWQSKIIHPSVVLILGKRGSGKSALGYRLLELNRYALTPYVLGLPRQGQGLLPDWIGVVQNLDNIPPESIVLVDEAYLRYHSRESLAASNIEMSRVLNLSRQMEQTLIFISQEARQVDKNIASSANVMVFKDLGMLQLEFDRPELSRIATQAKQALEKVKGDKRRWSYIHSPDKDFLGLLENSLPSFWNNKLSHVFATGVEKSATKLPKMMALEEKIAKAKELHKAGWSLSQIANYFGVTKSTVFNWVHGYPYRKN
jgi:hypothetical protein